MDAAWHDWDVSGVVPVGAKAVVLAGNLRGNAANLYLQFRKNGNSNSHAAVLWRTQVANIVMGFQVTVACDTNRVIEYSGSSSGIDLSNIAILGWHF